MIVHRSIMLSWSLAALLLLISCNDCHAGVAPHGVWLSSMALLVNKTKVSPPLLKQGSNVEAADISPNHKPLGKRVVCLRRQAISCCASFGIGVWDCLENYLTHYTRQAVVCYATVTVIEGRTGRFIAKPIVRLFQLATSSDILFHWQCAIWRSFDWVCGLFFHSEHKWYWYAESLVGAPVVEEVAYRLSTLECLKYIFRKLHRIKKQKSFETSHRVLTPWSIITSLWFAAGHLDLEAMRYPDFLSDSFVGRVRLAEVAGLVVQAFCGSLFMLSPMQEKHGIFAAIGQHFAWNFTVYVPGVKTTLLILHGLRLLNQLCFREGRHDDSDGDDIQS